MSDHETLPDDHELVVRDPCGDAGAPGEQAADVRKHAARSWFAAGVVDADAEAQRVFVGGGTRFYTSSTGRVADLPIGGNATVTARTGEDGAPTASRIVNSGSAAMPAVGFGDGRGDGQPPSGDGFFSNRSRPGADGAMPRTPTDGELRTPPADGSRRGSGVPGGSFGGQSLTGSITAIDASSLTVSSNDGSLSRPTVGAGTVPTPSSTGADS